MNYKHLYHAGNFADVIKHALYVALISKMQEKEKPFCIIDTHAGAGLYYLNSKESGRNKEFLHGASKLLALSSKNKALIWLKSFVETFNTNGKLSYYPGSPLIAQSLLRSNDRMILVEKHPVVFQQLKSTVGFDPRIALHQRDAYEAMIALTPPMPRRGIVLIDPPYEDKDEYSAIILNLEKCLQRWKNATYAIWYPIKSLSPPQQFFKGIEKLINGEDFFKVELKVLPHATPGLIGCGMIFINPPWKFESLAKEIIQELRPQLTRR